MDVKRFSTFLKDKKDIQKLFIDFPNGTLRFKIQFRRNSVINIQGLNADCELTVIEKERFTTIQFRCLSSVKGDLPVDADSILTNSIRSLMKEVGLLKNIKLLRYINGVKFAITTQKPLHSFVLEVPYHKQERLSSSIMGQDLKKRYNLKETEILYFRRLLSPIVYFKNRTDIGEIIDVDRGTFTEESKELLELNYRY